MYFGESTTRVDEKGRITVPRRVRETMNVEGHAIWYMTRGFDRCVFLFHRDEWMRIRKAARKPGAMNARALDFRRLLFGGVTEVRPDQQGRMAVAPHLRDHASIDKEAVLVGVDDHLELWNKDAWNGFLTQNEEEFKGMAGAIFGGAEPEPEPAETARGE